MRKTATPSRRRLATAAGAALALALTLAGCSTPGPLHVYTVAHERGEAHIRDHADAATAEVPSQLEDDDELLGFGYDPFTDHFFLRLAPGNKIRVVDRPARAIKREFEIEGLARGGDLAIRPRDGHVFFLEAGSGRVVETSRLGKTVRTVTLDGVAAPLGLACDLAQNHLLALHADGRTISRHDLASGRKLDILTLAQPVAGSLAYDSERAEFLAPLAGATAPEIGVFDTRGQLLRRIASARGRFVDIGPRSFVRVF